MVLERTIIREHSRREAVVAWLEARSCNEDVAEELGSQTILRLPPLREAMKVAENAASDQKEGEYWEYSIKLTNTEVEALAGLFADAPIAEDDRSERRTIHLKYNKRCYSLTLFVFKA